MITGTSSDSCSCFCFWLRLLGWSSSSPTSMLVCTRCDTVAVTPHLLLLPWSVVAWRPRVWLEGPMKMPTLLSSSCNPSPDASLQAPLPGCCHARGHREPPGQEPCSGLPSIPELVVLNVWGKDGKAKELLEEKEQECQCALCSRLGYRGAMEKLTSVIFGWKEVPCQARQTGGGKLRHSLGAAGSEFQYPLSLVNNSAALSVHLLLHWSQREQPCPPSNICLAIALPYILGVFSVWMLFSPSFFFFCFCPLTPL